MEQESSTPNPPNLRDHPVLQRLCGSGRMKFLRSKTDGNLIALEYNPALRYYHEVPIPDEILELLKQYQPQPSTTETPQQEQTSRPINTMAEPVEKNYEYAYPPAEMRHLYKGRLITRKTFHIAKFKHFTERIQAKTVEEALNQFIHICKRDKQVKNYVRIDEDGIHEMHIGNGLFTILEPNDVERVFEHSPIVCLNGYAYSTRTRQYLHTILMGRQPGLTVDHKNRRKLDNRRINLRFATQQVQLINRNMPRMKQIRVDCVQVRAPRGNGKYMEKRFNRKKHGDDYVEQATTFLFARLRAIEIYALALGLDVE